MDEESRKKQVQSLRERSGGPVGVISSISGEGLRPLVYEIWSVLQKMEPKIDLMSNEGGVVETGASSLHDET